MNNLILEQLLLGGEKFNTNAYTPTFLHDVLMLPGSLSNLIGTGKFGSSYFFMVPITISDLSFSLYLEHRAANDTRLAARLQRTHPLTIPSAGSDTIRRPKCPRAGNGCLWLR